MMIEIIKLPVVSKKEEKYELSKHLYSGLNREQKDVWNEIKALVPLEPLDWLLTVAPDCLLMATDILVELRNKPKKRGHKTLRRLLNSFLFEYKVSLKDRKRLGVNPRNINLRVKSRKETQGEAK